MPAGRHADGRDFRQPNRDEADPTRFVTGDTAGRICRVASGGDAVVSHDDAAQTESYTVRLELEDEPGELLRALEPVAERGGNLLSIFHERGNLTPRGHIPVEIDLECHPERFDDVVAALREASVNVVRAGQQRYGEEITVLLTGHVVETDLSDTLDRIQECSGASVVDLSLSAPKGMNDVASARLRLAAESTSVSQALETVREVAGEKELRLIEPLTPAGGDGS